MATATATRSKSKRTKVSFQPLDDRMLVRQADAEDTTIGGIILPDAAKEKPQRGTVVALGPGKLLDSGARGEMCVSIGDNVFYGKYAGTEIELEDDETYVIVRENDVLAVID